MLQNVKSVIAFLCILIYIAAAAFAGIQIHKAVGEQRFESQQEFADLADFAVRAGALGFFSNEYIEDIRTQLDMSKALDAVIIYGPGNNKAAFEKKQGLISYKGDTPGFNKQAKFYRTPQTTPLRVEGNQNISISAFSPLVNFNTLLATLRLSLLAVLIAVVIAFTTLIIDVSIGKPQYAPASKNAARFTGDEYTPPLAEKARLAHVESAGPSGEADADAEPDDSPDAAADAELALEKEPSGETDAGAELTVEENPSGETDAGAELAVEENPSGETDAGAELAVEENPSGETDAGAELTLEEEPAGETEAELALEEEPAGETEADAELTVEENPSGETDAGAELVLEEEPSGDMDAGAELVLEEEPSGETDAGAELALEEEPAGETEAELAVEEKTSGETDSDEELEFEAPQAGKGLLAAANAMYATDNFGSMDNGYSFVDALKQELRKAEASGADLTLLCIEWTAAGLQEEIFVKQTSAFFKNGSRVFERDGQGGVYVIVPGAGLDEIFAEAKEFHRRARELTPQNVYVELLMGISARSGRNVSAANLLNEAERAMDKARSNSALPIVAFKADPQKYKEFARRQKRL